MPEITLAVSDELYQAADDCGHRLGFCSHRASAAARVALALLAELPEYAYRARGKPILIRTTSEAQFNRLEAISYVLGFHDIGSYMLRAIEESISRKRFTAGQKKRIEAMCGESP